MDFIVRAGEFAGSHCNVCDAEIEADQAIRVDVDGDKARIRCAPCHDAVQAEIAAALDDVWRSIAACQSLESAKAIAQVRRMKAHAAAA